jgi:hypothetical protein
MKLSYKKFTEQQLRAHVIDPERVIAAKRVWTGDKYGKWEEIRVRDVIEQRQTSSTKNQPLAWTHHFSQGGTVKFYIGWTSFDECQKLVPQCEKVNFRQYQIPISGTNFPEPRVHSLLTKEPNKGYKYHQ